MKRVTSHYKLLLFIALALLSAWGIWQGTVEENMLALVPKHSKQQVKLFEHSPLSQKLIVITQAPDAIQAQQIA